MEKTIDRAVSTAEAAEIVGLTRRTLETLRCRGGGPPFLKIGKAVRYRVSSLLAWLDEHPEVRSSEELIEVERLRRLKSRTGKG
jgi:predicted DNA-binding transcriptional regulator AlpA